MHISVLSKEVLQGLSLSESDIVVDCTINGGGHSALISKQLGDQGILIGIDLDANALSVSRERLSAATCRVILKEGNYARLDEFLSEEHIEKADKYLFDLGLSSQQLDSSMRGFSFRFDEPLLMTFVPSPGSGDLTAREIVNDWEEESIADIIFGYGEERFARHIASKIVEARKKKTIETTGELVSIIKSATPHWYQHKRKHFATKTFQALRITVNNEMENVKEGVRKAIARTNEKGRVVVITFHSIEDRIVKNIFKEAAKDGEGVIITKKPIQPADSEIRENPRARSAKLRIFEKA